MRPVKDAPQKEGTDMKRLVRNAVTAIIDEPALGFAEFIIIAVLITLLLMPLH